MRGLREYKFLLLSGLALVVFAFLVFGVASGEDAEAKEYPYLDNLFAEGVVNEINIEISEEDWADLVENPLEETYYAVDVTINGETLSNVALRTKGNNTLTSVASSDSDRYSFKIDFDYFNDGENYYGLKKLNLNNNYGMPVTCGNIFPIASWVKWAFPSPLPAIPISPSTEKNGACIWQWNPLTKSFWSVPLGTAQEICINRTALARIWFIVGMTCQNIPVWC